MGMEKEKRRGGERERERGIDPEILHIALTGVDDEDDKLII
jgi:hypothetical protein